MAAFANTDDGINTDDGEMANPNGEEDFPVRGYEGDSSYYRGGWDDNEESSSYYRWDDDEESDDGWDDDAPSDDAVATH